MAARKASQFGPNAEVYSAQEYELLKAENTRLGKIVANLCQHSVLSCAADCKCERERPDDWRQRYWDSEKDRQTLRERLYAVEKSSILLRRAARAFPNDDG